MTFFIFVAWILINSLILNIGIKAGWNYDPGYIGPILLVFLLNITIAMYGSKNRKES